MELGDLIADKYKIDRFLGEGGMGTVFAATNVVTGKAVAIKCLHADLTQNEEYPARFLREAQVAGRIDHPNVVNVFDVGRHDSALFLVMELLQGETLASYMARGPQDPTTFIQLLLPALRGVHAAHRIGVTHRDLKPDNIFLCRGPDGEPREAKVLDFGISKIGEEIAGGGRHQLTLEGAIFGTPQYMAPEQIRSARSADARSDVYALGVILYRAFSGEFPFDAETLPGLALRIVEGHPTPLLELCPELEPDLADVVARSLALDPAERFQSVAALGEALEPFADGFTFATSSGSWAEVGEGERFSREGQRTPNLRRPRSLQGKTPASQPRQTTPASPAARQRTPASQSRQPKPASRARLEYGAEDGPELASPASPASATPAGQSWQRARAPTLGVLALLFLSLGGVGTWLLLRQLGAVSDPTARGTSAGLEPSAPSPESGSAQRTGAQAGAGSEGAPSSEPRRSLDAPQGLPEPAVLGAPPTSPALAPSSVVAAPAAEQPLAPEPQQPLAPTESGRSHRRERHRESERKPESAVLAAPSEPKPAAQEPAPAPAREEPRKPAAPQDSQLIHNADGNPYLRH